MAEGSAGSTELLRSIPHIQFLSGNLSARWITYHNNSHHVPCTLRPERTWAQRRCRWPMATPHWPWRRGGLELWKPGGRRSSARPRGVAVFPTSAVRVGEAPWTAGPARRARRTAAYCLPLFLSPGPEAGEATKLASVPLRADQQHQTPVRPASSVLARRARLRPQYSPS